MLVNWAKDKILYFRPMLQLLRILAFPFSLLYGLVVYLRNRLYDMGFFKSVSYQTPIISVGNLSVGGTGKTPMIEYLIHLLQGHKVSVLSRGYKRKSDGFLLADSKSTAEDLGDEPFQIHKKFPEVSLAVDADRRNGIQRLEDLVRPDVVLLDDAFQHRRVKPKFSILLTAYGKLYANDWYLPTGNLRDHKGESKRADLIVVTKCPEGMSETEKIQVTKRLKPKPYQKVLFCSLDYSSEIKSFSGETVALTTLKGKKLAVVTGIASPKPLIAYLESRGLQFEHFKYGDHHYFTDSEIQKFSGFEVILTTEKDYVRLEGKVNNLYYIEVAHRFEEKDQQILREYVLSQI